jgi:ribosomal protein S14
MKITFRISRIFRPWPEGRRDLLAAASSKGDGMSKIKKCRQCGVPLGFSRGLVWHGNGVITQARDPDHRFIFSESDFLDELFASLEKITGSPIELMVIESKRRLTRNYMENQISPLKRKLLHRYNPRLLSRRISDMGRHYGYGDITLHELRTKNDEEDYQAIRIRHPYSLPLFCGDGLGSKEAMDGRDFSVSWEQVGEHEFLVTFRAGRHSLLLPESPQEKKHGFKPGDIEYKRCALCGVPLGVARCRWNLEEGTIYDPGTGRRMAVFSPDSIEAILRDIGEELDGDLADAVIEAQRRFVRRMLGREDALIGQPAFRDMAGLRGLGYIRELELEKDRSSVHIENPCLPLFMVGISQALFEMGSDNEKVNRSWEMLPDGDLVVELWA